MGPLDLPWGEVLFILQGKWWVCPQTQSYMSEPVLEYLPTQGRADPLEYRLMGSAGSWELKSAILWVLRGKYQPSSQEIWEWPTPKQSLMSPETAQTLVLASAAASPAKLRYNTCCSEWNARRCCEIHPRRQDNFLFSGCYCWEGLATLRKCGSCGIRGWLSTRILVATLPHLSPNASYSRLYSGDSSLHQSPGWASVNKSPVFWTFLKKVFCPWQALSLPSG